MCGQVGMIFGPKQRPTSELDYLRKLFGFLLLLSEERGPHATGVVWLKRGGQHRILKRPQRAKEFICSDAYRDALAGVDSAVTWLGGHTRWQTVGDASNNLNNHPIRAGEVIGTHNGTIINADSLFARFGLQRSAEVDSELIFRFANSTLLQGRIDIATLKSRLALCKGGISAVMASRTSPEEVVIIKGNKPLEIRYSQAHQAVVYSSDARYPDMALAADRSWKPVSLGPMIIAALNCDCLKTSRCESFHLANHREVDRFQIR